MAHKSGFVNIIGSPNVGKSTLMNELVGERLSIITSKAQTTRHRILGIVNEDEYQICFSDTPGVLIPSYKLQEGMMQFVDSALKDADLFLFVTDFFEDELNDPEILERLKKTSAPILVLINKLDLIDQQKMEAKTEAWSKKLPEAHILPISALHKANVDLVMECTGKFNNAEECQKHINAGASKVLISAPAKDADLTVVYLSLIHI